MSVDLGATKESQVENESPEKRRRWPLLLALLAGVLIVVNWGFGSSDVVTQAFEEPVQKLVIETNGRVAVTAGAVTEIELSSEWSLMARPSVDLRLEDGVLTATSDCGLWLLIRCETDVDALVPAGTEVVVITSSGAVSATGVTGGADLRTSAGAIEVENVAGAVRMRTSAGSIRGTISSGDIEARTSAGAITLAVVTSLERLTAVTSAGAVDLTVPDDIYRVETDTAAGRVELEVRTDPDSDRVISARSAAGSISIRRTTP